MFQQIFLFEGKPQNGQTNDKSYDVDADDSAVIDGARPKRILMLMPILISWPSAGGNVLEWRSLRCYQLLSFSLEPLWLHLKLSTEYLISDILEFYVPFLMSITFVMF